MKSVADLLAMAHLPAALVTTLHLLGQCAFPVSLVLIGATIADHLGQLRSGEGWGMVLPALLLRIAVLLHRGRGRAPLPDISLAVRGRTLEIRFPVRWLRAHPLTVADLSQEIDLLAAADFRLRVYSSRGLPAV